MTTLMGRHKSPDHRADEAGPWGIMTKSGRLRLRPFSKQLGQTRTA